MPVQNLTSCQILITRYLELFSLTSSGRTFKHNTESVLATIKRLDNSSCQFTPTAALTKNENRWNHTATIWPGRTSITFFNLNTFTCKYGSCKALQSSVKLVCSPFVYGLFSLFIYHLKLILVFPKTQTAHSFTLELLYYMHPENTKDG